MFLMFNSDAWIIQYLSHLSTNSASILCMQKICHHKTASPFLDSTLFNLDTGKWSLMILPTVCLFPIRHHGQRRSAGGKEQRLRHPQVQTPEEDPAGSRTLLLHPDCRTGSVLFLQGTPPAGRVRRRLTDSNHFMVNPSETLRLQKKQILQLFWQDCWIGESRVKHPLPNSQLRWSVWAASTRSSALPKGAFFFSFWQTSVRAYRARSLQTENSVAGSIFRSFKSLHIYTSPLTFSTCLFSCPLISPERLLHLPPVPLSVLLWLLAAGMSTVHTRQPQTLYPLLFAFISWLLLHDSWF